MTAAQFRAQILGHVDNVSPTDAAYADRESRVDEWAVETSSDLWYRRPWSWRRSTDDATVDINAAGNLPDDFGAIGHMGGVYLASGGDRLTWVSEQEIMEMRQQPEGATSTPEVYSIFGQDVNLGVSHLRIQLPPVSGTLNLVIDYEVIPPSTLATVLEQWPAQYHQPVLIPFVRARALDSKGDARAQTWFSMAEKAYRNMAIEERRGKENSRVMRSFFGSSR